MTHLLDVRAVLLALVTAWMFTTSAAARGALVAPGQALPLRSSEYLAPAGDVLAEDAVPFFLVLEAPDSDAAPSAVPGTLTSTVVRGQGSGLLTFVYAIDFAGQGEDGSGGATQVSKLWATGFDSVRTEVAAKLAFEELFLASRSADGLTLLLESDTPGEGGSPTLLVRTDATDFDNGGVIRFAAADPFLLPGPVDGSGAAGGMVSVVASGEVELSGVFRPLPGDSRPGPHPIPLPPAVFTGMGGLIACAILRAGWVRGLRRR